MEGAGGEKLSRRRRMGVFSFGGIGAFFFRSSKSAFCLSTSPKAPCWRFPILAMTMFEQARHCSFGLTKTLVLLANALVLLTNALVLLTDALVLSNNHSIAA